MMILIAEIIMTLIVHFTGKIWGWNLGLYIQLIMLPVVVANFWDYLFFEGNEMGRYIDKYLSNSAEEYKRALRDDSSNPLYVKGYFRKNYKKNPKSKMAKLKGHYFCQMVAIIQIVVMVARIIYIIIFWEKYLQPQPVPIWPDLVIMIWLLLNTFLYMGFTDYYMFVFRQEKMKEAINDVTEQRNPDICINVFPNDNYEVFFYRNSLENILRMHKIREGFANYYLERKETFFVKKIRGCKGKLMFTAYEDTENIKTHMLIQYYCSSLERKDIDELNQVIQEELSSIMKFKQISSETVCITYIIFVEDISNAFIDLFCGEIEQKEDCFRLPVGIVLTSGELYVSGMKNVYGYEEYQMMKNTILDVLKSIPKENGM